MSVFALRAVRDGATQVLRRWWGAERYIVGYPKCGNTWVQVMVRKALVLAYGLPETAMSTVLNEWRFRQLVTGIPAIGITHHMPRFNDESSRTMQLDFSVFRHRKVVLLIRDPKDVLVSLYMHNVHRERVPLYQGDIGSMVMDEVYGLEKYLAYYTAWHANRGLPRALRLVRYEDLSQETAGVLKEMLEFLDLPNVTDELVRDVVAYGSFENMRKLETTNALQLPTLAAPQRTAEEAFKVRKGIVGDYVNHLSPETIRDIDRRVQAELPPFYGYASARPSEPAHALIR